MTQPSPAAAEFVAGLNAKFADLDQPFARKYFAVQPGKRFDRIVVGKDAEDTYISAHAFVERETGYVFKTDGWKRPAKGIRYITVEDAVAHADLNGGYLYAGRS